MRARVMFAISWWIIFPLACGLLACSISPAYSMSGKLNGLFVHPSIVFSIPLFAFTGFATFEYFRRSRMAAFLTLFFFMGFVATYVAHINQDHFIKK